MKSWDSTFKEIGASLDVSEDLDGDGRPDSGSLNIAISSVDAYDNRLLVATRGSDIFEALMPRTTKDALVLTRCGTRITT